MPRRLKPFPPAVPPPPGGRKTDRPPPCRCCGKAPARENLSPTSLPGRAFFCSLECAASYGVAAALRTGGAYCHRHKTWYGGWCPLCPKPVRENPF